MTEDDFLRQLRIDEGFFSKPYKDTVGVLTIGYGTNLEQGITHKQAEYLMQCELEDCVKELEQTDWYPDLPTNIKFVMQNMCYNMGIVKLSGFHRTIAYLKAKDWKNAAKQMLNSKWAKQVHARATRLALIVSEGQ